MKPGETSREDKQLSMTERFIALSRVGAALMSEFDEERLLHMIAETACELTGASFAAFTLRPVNEEGQPLVPSEGYLFRLAAVVGVSEAQEKLLRRISLGGEGLLAPIFRQGVSVRVADALALVHSHENPHSLEGQDAAREAAIAYAHGHIPAEGLHYMGVPRGHPIVRSFLGAPLLDRERQVRGGLLLGHVEADKFTQEDESLLVGLAAQAAVALENARLYNSVQMRAQELNAIFESIADGVTLVDSHGRILRENGTARLLREALQARPDGKQTIEALLHEPARQALRGETAQDITVTMPDERNERREYLVNVSPLNAPTSSGPLAHAHTIKNDGKQMIAGAVVVWHDVTEARRLIIERRIHAETEARRALLQRILDELPSSVYLVRGRDARLVLANRALAKVWGATWTQGKSMSEFLQESGIRISRIDGHPMEHMQLATIRALHFNETIRSQQEIIRHADGTTMPVLVSAVPISGVDLNMSLWDTTRPVGNEVDETEPAAIVVHQDVTALKEAEALKDEFIGIAAHELRNPLAVLKGFAQMLIVQTARGKGPKLTDWQIEAIEGIDQSTLRMVELIDDLLDVTRLQAGRLELYPEPTNLIDLTRRVITKLQITTDRHTFTLHTELEHLVVNLDARRMEQVLNNILGNAIKYSPDGGSIDITIDENCEQQVALLSIQDGGIGIPLSQQARVFGRFVRAENAQALGIGGTGLGLYLSRELVERHGGRIWFESTEGKGSTFFIALPLEDFPSNPQ
ncbi:MAG TPA: ATP-binding protein [Ktedonobacteraceae bacterium]|nr:ATP-binding protein [Ktedonobacteraceae bacterium]